METKRCMVCAKERPLNGGICNPCQEQIRREALGEQADIRNRSDKELQKHGIEPDRKPKGQS